MQTRLIELRRYHRQRALAGALLSLSRLTPHSSDPHNDQGEAILLNLSIGGCNITTDLPLLTRQPYRLLIQHTLYDTPIAIQQALVIWNNAPTYGLHFVEIHEDDAQALKAFLSRLPILTRSPHA